MHEPPCTPAIVARPSRSSTASAAASAEMRPPLGSAHTAALDAVPPAAAHDPTPTSRKFAGRRVTPESGAPESGAPEKCPACRWVVLSD